MPTFRRKRVLLVEPSQTLLSCAKSNPNKHVYYLEKTGEIFDSYEEYAARMSFYKLKQFQCEVTGRSNLDYFAALESEQSEARTLHSRFSEQLKPAVLKAVQFQVIGRLDHLVEAVYERFKDRYYKGERVLVDVAGAKYFARVEKVYPPRSRVADSAPSSSSASASPDTNIHIISGDLKIPAKEANAKDDPTAYYYWVHILEPEKRSDSNKLSAATKAANLARDESVVKSLMEIRCNLMSRDRLSFSKSILRRFIRDCVDRSAAVASPWIVKPSIAQRYGVPTSKPEEQKKDSEKRKKNWDESEQPPSKKRKSGNDASAEAAAKKEAADKAKAEEAEKKKKKPVRYPTEDLDVRLNDRDIKAGMKLVRPTPSSTAVPFNTIPRVFESFVFAWNFLSVYGQPLHLSSFTLDEFEHAIRHSVADPPCPLLAEVHSTLIYNLRTVPFVRHSALLSLLRRKEEENPGVSEVFGVTIDQLSAAMADVGNNWERVPLRFAEGRVGWEDAMVGSLKDHATLENFPRLREILSRLLFAPEEVNVTSNGSSSSRASTPTKGPEILSVAVTPGERYYTLPAEDRVAILSFMCNIAVSSKAIHAHMESCEEQLTALRKEKIEVNRSKKQFVEEMANLKSEMKEEPSAPNSDAGANDQSEASDAEGSENKSRMSTREQLRAKTAASKKALAEHRRLDEEVNKIERRLEGIEREFRKLLGAVRVKPLGRDRFFNRIWWFDGMGSASLVGSGGVVQYGTGRLFIQGPSEFDMEILDQRKDEVERRRREEEGDDGILQPWEWAVYSEIEEVDAFVAWLNSKGNRELALKNTITKWWPHIAPGIRKRQADLSINAKLPEARRSTRTRNGGSGHDVTKEPYMMWTNRRAV